MKTIYLQIKWLFLLLIVLAIGCTQSPSAYNTQQEHKFTSKLLFNVAQPVTKSAAAENAVQRLDILLFNKGKLEKVLRNITSFNTSDEGFSSVEVGFDTEGVRQAYVIANIDSDLWLNSLVEGTTTIAQITTCQTANLTKMANPPLVMYGISGDMEFSTAQSSVLCQLYRAVARINIENKASNFAITSARLINAKTASNIFPNSVFSSSEVSDFEPQSADGSNSIRLYTYENNAQDVSKATKVELTGTVNGSPLTYTVDLTQDDRLIPLERNYQYTINVNNVQDNKINVNIEVVPWKLGSDIEEVLNGNSPIVQVTILPEVGAYSAADSSFALTSKGGQIVWDARANAECGMEITGNWLTLQPQTKAGSYIAGQFTLTASENTSSSERNATVRIFNKLSNSSKTFSLKQSAMEVQRDKYMVLVVAGQSNAVGCDESPYDDLDAPHPRAFQLSYRRGVEKRNLDIIPLTYSPDDIDNAIEVNNKRLLKGIHLPLAKELLKNIPQDYKLLVIPVAYGGAGFTWWGNADMGYDNVNLQPLVMTGRTLRWGLNAPYHKTLVDRAKYALTMNPDNKFIGIVWCQGESDGNAPDDHYQAFTTMANSINEELNASFADRSANGVIDKRSWFCYSSTIRFSDWYRTTETTAVFGGYKYWNPNTFIHIPLTTPTNLPGGVGQGEIHFGQNAYRNVIAPLVADCINKNGMLFNGAQKDLNRYKDKSTVADADRYGGSINDADLSAGLVLFAPLSESTNSIIKTVGSAYVSASNQTMEQADDMPSLTGTPRGRKVLTFNNNFTRIKGGPTLSNWTVSFMFKRTGNMINPVQVICHNGKSDSFFFGFHKLDSRYVQGISEFSAELSFATNRNNTVPGLFFESEKVTRYDEWIHYVITYDNATGNMTTYMNGDQVYSRAMSTKRSIVCTDIFIGSGSALYPSAAGQLADFGMWNQVLSQNSIKKLFYMSYYGYTK